MLQRVNRKGLAQGGGARPLVSALLALLGCGGAAGAGPQSPSNYPPYDPHSEALFDDGFEPEAVGFPTDHVNPPSTSNRLRERSQVGDAVVRARVMTVDEDTSRNWQLAFHTVEVLHVAGAPTGATSSPGATLADFTLKIEPTDTSAGIVNSMASRLVGRTFVVFMRTFAHAPIPAAQTPEPPDLHFHIAADSKDEIEAVRSAILLNEVR